MTGSHRAKHRRMGRPDRRTAERRGRLAEALCRWHLRLSGWRILAHDWRCPVGEIDILARRGRVLAVIEVKTRRDLDTAVASILPRQRRRIMRATEAFLTMRPDLVDLDIRFDVMLVEIGRLPRHLRAAWRSDA
jgi:putative endonuclease